MDIDVILKKFDEIKHTLMSIVHLDRMLLNSQSQVHIARIQESDRGSDPLRLLKYGWKVFSQNDEDGIIEEIFKRIGTETRKFLEFGVEGGTECNSLYLLNTGWKGVWFEASDKHVGNINRTHADWVADGSLKLIQSFVDKDNIEILMRDSDTLNVDLLSIDIDGNDYHVWKAVETARPRLLIIEYTAVMGRMIDWVVKYDPKRSYDGTHYHGASLAAYEKLGRQKGYSLVGCNINGCNAFFVRDDLLLDKSGEDRFRRPFTAENHYEEFRHPFVKFLAGKRVSPKRGTSHDEINSYE